ncbi:MAG: glutamate ligase domain-containing protein, partial [Gammaproteobacteria bacterium]
ERPVPSGYMHRPLLTKPGAARKTGGVGRFRARAAAVLNVSPDHLDYHRSIGEYAEIKSRVYNFAERRVINLDDPLVVRMNAAYKKGETITFSARRRADFFAERGGLFGGGMRFSRRKLSPALTAENALAGLALFFALAERPSKTAAAREELARVLAEFPGLPHRLRRVDGAPFDAIDDSKSTNVASACFALRHTSGDIILVAGGDGKGQDFSPLAAACRPMKNRAVKKALLFGKDARVLSAALRGGGVECKIVSDMEEAVGGAAKLARNGGTVLLSPACSSLDMYRDYAARGDAFAAACRAIRAGRKGRKHAA